MSRLDQIRDGYKGKENMKARKERLKKLKEEMFIPDTELLIKTVDSRIRMKCNFKGGRKRKWNSTIDWTFNDAQSFNKTNKGANPIHINRKSWELIIEKAELTDEGVYKCKLDNELLSIVQLKVQRSLTKMDSFLIYVRYSSVIIIMLVLVYMLAQAARSSKGFLKKDFERKK